MIEFYKVLSGTEKSSNLSLSLPVLRTGKHQMKLSSKRFKKNEGRILFETAQS